MYGAKVTGAVLAFTGLSLVAPLAAVLILIAVGLAFWRLAPRRSEK